MQDFLDLDGTWLYIAETDPSPLTDRMWAIDGSSAAAVRFVRGMRMTNVNDLFNEWSAALQFPYYFGGNWAAVDECIVDLDWLHAEAYVLVVLEAGYALPDDNDFSVLLKILRSAATEWSEPDEFRTARPFKVVLQETSESRTGKLRERLERLGYPTSPLPPS